MKGPLLSRLQRSKLRLVPTALAVVATIACVTAGSVPASASALPGAGSPGPSVPPSISEPVALIGAIAPDLLAQTRQPATAEQAASFAAQTGRSAFRIEVPADPSTPIALAPTQAEGAGLPVSIRIEGASGQGVTTDGITTYAQGGTGRAVSSVQPLENGVRLLTALAGAEAGESFSYDLGLPAGFTVTPMPDGLSLLAAADGRYIGTLGAAWATDAAGTPLATRYEWSGSTLMQKVELTPDTSYPVLLDPTWYYDYDFSAQLPGYHARYPKGLDYKVERLLQGCFNCYFPIDGAPRGYPADGSLLSLNASPFSLIPAAAAPVRVQTVSGGAMQFVAQPGHFDGAGSTITFAWYNDAAGYLHLFVHAMVLADWGVLRDANRLAAGIAWLNFWQKVADNVGTTGGGGGV